LNGVRDEPEHAADTNIVRTRIGEDLHLGFAPRTSSVSIAPPQAEDRPNGRPDVGFKPCLFAARSVRLRGRPHARNDRYKSLRGACRCWNGGAVNLPYSTAAPPAGLSSSRGSVTPVREASVNAI
jgi:hypothetical protein